LSQNLIFFIKAVTFLLVLFEELVDDIISKCFLQKSELYVHKAATMIVYIVWS